MGTSRDIAAELREPTRSQRATGRDAAHWDERYGTKEFIWKTEPNQFLAPEVQDLVVGRALDIACGEGRNAVWLATQGWETTGVDFSAVGLTKGAALAEANGVTVEWIAADVTVWESPADFDLVVIFYLQVPALLRRKAFARAAQRLAPGGTLLIIGHDLVNLTEGVGGPKDPDVLYTPDDVRADLDTSGIADLVIERAERVRRPVATETGHVMAIDCLVRARRSDEPS